MVSNHNPCAIDHIGVFVGINHWVNPITGLPELQWRPHTSSTKDYPVFYHQQTWGIPLPYSSTKGVHLCEATYPVWWLQPATQVNINYMSTTLWLQSSIALSYCLSLSLWLNWISTSLSITPIYSVLIYLTSKNKSQLGSLTCSDFFFRYHGFWILLDMFHAFSHIPWFMWPFPRNFRLPTAWHRPSPWPLAPVPPWPFPTPTWSVGEWTAMIPGWNCL